MAEEQDRSQKTEDPTEHKLQRAREQGQVPRSREVNNFFMLLGILICLVLALPACLENLMNTMGAVLTEAGSHMWAENAQVGPLLLTLVYRTFVAIAPVLGLLLVLSFLGGIVQTGFMWSTDSIMFNPGRINPIKGLGRLFSMRSMVELLKSLVKIAILGTVMGIVLYQHYKQFLLLTDMGLGDIVRFVQQVMVQLVASVMGIVLLLAALDFLYQRFEFLRDQRMTKDELKREIRDTMGDPHIRQRQRQIRMERMRMRMMAEVPKAQVVITNPTHFAIALAYDQEKDPAPRIVAKGADHVAQRIRELAREHDVPIVEDAPLARSLYAQADVGQSIPLEFYQAVAKIISYVFGLQARGAKRA